METMIVADDEVVPTKTWENPNEADYICHRFEQGHARHGDLLRLAALAVLGTRPVYFDIDP